MVRSVTVHGYGHTTMATSLFEAVVAAPAGGWIMGGMDQEALNRALPIVPHDDMGECCGCIVGRIAGEVVTLVCNECGVQVGWVRTEILAGLLGIDAARAVCPYCEAVHVSPGLTRIEAFVCKGCGRAVDLSGTVQ